MNDTNNSKDNSIKLCPICRSEIIVTGYARLETLSEHVSDPNGEVSMKARYNCMNKNCEAYEKVSWNEYGEIYSDRDVNIYRNPLNFVDGNNAPFGTWQRRSNVEISKHDEDFYLFKNLFGWKLRVEWKYKSNDDGDILSKKIKLRWITPDGAWYTSGIHMFFYMLRSYKVARSGFALPGKKVEDYFKITWDKRWWKVASVYFLRVFQYRVYKSLKQ